jgi:putative addiction module component (TIGR02574 family)
MSTKIDEILKPALKLRRSQRAKVAAELIASLDGPREKDLKEAWANELARRVQDVRENHINLEDWDSVRAEIARVLRTR